jgi:hypothetical protein
MDASLIILFLDALDQKAKSKKLTTSAKSSNLNISLATALSSVMFHCQTDWTKLN